MKLRHLALLTVVAASLAGTGATFIFAQKPSPDLEASFCHYEFEDDGSPVQVGSAEGAYEQSENGAEERFFGGKGRLTAFSAAAAPVVALGAAAGLLRVRKRRRRGSETHETKRQDSWERNR